MNLYYSSVLTSSQMSTFVFVWKAVDILPRCTLYVKPSPRLLYHIMQSLWMNRVRMSWRELILLMIDRCWSLIRDVQNPRSLVVQVREQGIKNRTVRKGHTCVLASVACLIKFIKQQQLVQIVDSKTLNAWARLKKLFQEQTWHSELPYNCIPDGLLSGRSSMSLCDARPFHLFFDRHSTSSPSSTTKFCLRRFRHNRFSFHWFLLWRCSKDGCRSSYFNFRLRISSRWAGTRIAKSSLTTSKSMGWSILDGNCRQCNSCVLYPSYKLVSMLADI